MFGHVPIYKSRSAGVLAGIDHACFLQSIGRRSKLIALEKDHCPCEIADQDKGADHKMTTADN